MSDDVLLYMFTIPTFFFSDYMKLRVEKDVGKKVIKT